MGGQGGERRPLPAVSLLTHSSRPDLYLCLWGWGACQGRVLYGHQRKGDISLKGEGYRNMATAASPLRAISLKIISKWARPILG